MGKLFISYRRDDTADVCGRIYDRLVAEFGKDSVFKDVDNIPLGADFRRILQDAVGQCDALLAVIGRQWLTITGGGGHPRLFDPADFVHIEIGSALARGIPVIPILVQDAAIPGQRDLPDDLADLPYRNGIQIRSDPHFHRDMDLLIQRLRPLFPATSASPQQMVRTMASTVPPERFPARLTQLGYTAQMLAGQEVILPPLCDVPAGACLIGSDLDREALDDEMPQHPLTLPAFQIARFPVTVAEYACFVRAGHAAPSSRLNTVSWAEQVQRLDHPVVNVSWHDAVAYATWLAERTGAPWRLPAEAEWEKAARWVAWDATSGHARIYPWGDSFDASCCNTRESKIGTTTPVGSYPTGASPFNVQDVAGNVWEWTSSLYKPYPYSLGDGRERIDASGKRVLRGGSWNNFAGLARAAFRNYSEPGSLLGNNGFRLVCAVVTS